MPNWRKIVTSGSDASLNSLEIATDLTISGALYDNNGLTGTSGQVLTSTVTGLEWADSTGGEATETARDLVISGKNVTATTIPKGMPLYFTASGVSGNVVGVMPADAGNPDRMPAGGVAAEELTAGSEGSVYIYGFINGVDTSAFGSGDDVYVAVGGGYTNEKPTGSALIQKLGNVEKVDATNGSGVIQGPSWFNDLPNWEEGKIKVGVSDGQPVTSSFIHLDESNGRLGIGTTSPSQVLDVVGDVEIDGKIHLNDGGSSVFVGTDAGLNDDASDNYNVGVGYRALYSNTTGTGNIATGHEALYSNTTGNLNTATGRRVLFSNTTGERNTATGIGALYSNTTGNLNTAVGREALRENTTGDNNTAIGNRAGRYTSTDDNNTLPSSSVFIGYDTRPNADSQTNQIVIGSEARGLGSNTAVLGNSSIVTTRLQGNVGIGTDTPANTLDVNGGIDATTLNTGQGDNELYAMNQNVRTTDSVTFGNITNSGAYTSNDTSTRDKIRVWDNSSYTIGMQGGNTFGALNDYAMTFQMDSTDNRGWWWGDSAHTTSQGAMSLTTIGELTLAKSVRVGWGESDTVTATSPLEVYGSGSTVVSVDGSTGRLFELTDSMDGSLFSVNRISGLPILEVFSDNSINMGTYGSEELAIRTGKVGINTTTPQTELDVDGVITSDRIILSQTTGTAPLTVSSTTVVTNLNADLLDGQHGSYYQPASTALTTSTSFGGDVSGTYNNIVVANDSHTHDGRYYTETEIGNFFSGGTSITGYNKTNWDTAFGWGNHAGLYMTEGQTRTDINTIVNGGNRYDPSANNPTNEHYAVLTYGNRGNVTGQLATHFQTGNLYSRGYNSSWSAWRRYWNSTDFSSTNISNWDTAYGDKIDSATFSTSTGVLTLTRQDAGTVTVDLDGRYSTTDTTYSAGNGITLTGTTFSVSAGGGLTQDAGGLSHSDTSTQASVNNSGGTVIQDVTLDGYGHVTGLVSYNLDGRYYTETESDARYLGISAKAADSNLLDGIDSSAFLRSNTADTATGALRFQNDLNYFGIATTNNEAEIVVNTGNDGSPQIGFTEHGDASWAIGVDDGDNSFKIHGTANATIPTINNLATPLFEITTTAGTAYLNGGTIWHSGNDGAGTGLNADLLDGYHASTTRNAANTIPIRDANGYLQLGWINTTSGATTSTINKIYASNDDYIRYVTPATLISQLGLWTSGNDGAGSGLDADLWDGNQFSSYLNQAVLTTSSPTFAGLNLGSGNLNTVENIYLDNAIYSEGDTDTYMQFHAADQWRVVTGNGERIEANSSGLLVTGQISTGIGYTELYLMNQNVRTTDSVTFGNITNSGVYTANGTSTRDKIRVWSTVPYTIGMQAGITFGALNNYAMTFQMDSTDNRGWWWGDNVHTVSQGAMSLTTIGELTLAKSIRVGWGESDTVTATSPLEVYGSGGTVMSVDGSTGRLFELTDSMSGSLFSVNDVSGLPILEVFSDNSINMGTFGDEELKITNRLSTFRGDILVTGGDDTTIKLQQGSNTSFFKITQSGDNVSQLNHYNDYSGNALLDISAMPSDGTSTANIRFNRYTNTTGASGVQVLRGDNTSGVNTFLSGNANSYLNQLVGNVGIGTTSPSQKLDVVGKIALNDGGNSVFVGEGAGFNDDGTDNRNVGIGYQTLYANTTGQNSTAYGFQALGSNTSGYNNVANGYRALYVNTIGHNNTAIGVLALDSNTEGFGNTGIGSHALSTNTTADNNTAVGYFALQSNTASNNTAVGKDALKSNTTGTNGAAVGYLALQANTTGYNNTAFGYAASFQNTLGYRNTAIGFHSLLNNQTGVENVALGAEAGRYASNVANVTTANNSIFIGYDSRPLLNNGTNEIVIGSEARGLGSNSTVIGNASTTKTLIYGRIEGESALHVPIINRTTTHELSSGDAGAYIRVNSASAVNVFVPRFEYTTTGVVITISQTGAGQVTVVGNSGVTLNGDKKTAGQYKSLQLVLTSIGLSEDVWDVIGGVP